MYIYSPENAALYSQLGVIGTTYEVSFNEMARLLGNLEGKTVLDFGCGTGRSTRLLKSLGAQNAIGVDHNTSMIDQAQRQHFDGIVFHTIDTIIPLPDESADAAVAAHVFVEMKTKEEMIHAAREIHRVLKRGGECILISTNPDSLGHEYNSWSYKRQDNIHSGDTMICTVKGEKPFDIQDVYWTEQDYRDVLTTARFIIQDVTFPTAQGDGWIDETQVGPDIVINSIKPAA